VGIQVFGHDLEAMLRTVEIVEASKPDFIDINYGCPVKKVVNRGAGAGMLKDIPKMIAITKAMVKHTKLPVTVKTRLGWDADSIEIVDVAERLQDVGIEALAIHGRTRAQMYKGNADWIPIGQVKNNPRMYIPIFGNGDVTSPEKAVIMRDEFGLDGAMIGRASIGNPWFFKQIKHFIATGKHLSSPSIAERVNVAKRHLEMAMEWNGERVALMETRKHYTSYFKGIPNIKEYRLKMLTAPTKEEVFEVFNEVLRVFS
jgi:nifR3 family TIM-barrel protein